MENRRAKRAQRHDAGEMRVAAALRAAAEQRRAAAAAVAQPLPGGEAVRAPAAPQRSVPANVYRSFLGKPNSNRLPAEKVKGRQHLPLPRQAPLIEASYFKLKREDKTGDDVIDMQMEEIYNEDCNEIGDKRREVLHCIASPEYDDDEEQLLSDQLDGLMSRAYEKVLKLLNTTGHEMHLPDHFRKYPALSR